MNVMVVEDDLISRKWLQRFLGKWGYDVTSYADGEAAWTALESGAQPELILADWMMPKMDGVELCKNIRSNPKTHHAYVIMLTARSEKTDLISGLEAGADDYLVKPVDPDELKTRLRVGERTLGLRSQLAERVSELESMLRRHSILGEAYTRSFLSDPGPADPALGDQCLDRVGALLDRCFGQMGWTRHIDPTSPGGENGSLAMSSALVLPGSGAWIDLVFELSDESASWWFASMMGRPPVDRREVSEGLIESLNIVQSALKTAFAANGQVAHVPFHPSPTRIVAPPTDPGVKRLAFEAGKARLVVSLAETELHVSTKKIDELTESDVFGEDVTLETGKERVSARSGTIPRSEWLAAVRSAARKERNREIRILSKASVAAGLGAQLFDPQALLKNTDGDEELCQEIVRCFLSDNATAFDRAWEAVEAGDWTSAVATAHSLKGSVSYFSKEVAREIADVERAASQKDEARIREAAPRVRKVIDRLVGELNQFLEDTGPEAKAS